VIISYWIEKEKVKRFTFGSSIGIATAKRLLILHPNESPIIKI